MSLDNNDLDRLEQWIINIVRREIPLILEEQRRKAAESGPPKSDCTATSRLIPKEIIDPSPQIIINHSANHNTPLESVKEFAGQLSKPRPKKGVVCSKCQNTKPGRWVKETENGKICTMCLGESPMLSPTPAANKGYINQLIGRESSKANHE